MTPDDVLKRVIDTINERSNDYGSPDVMFHDIARRWGCSKRDVALSMADLKLARLAHNWSDDSAVDAIAYLVFAIMFSGDA